MIDTAFLGREAAAMGIVLEAPALTQFQTFATMLVETNKNINLTAITEPREIVIKHFLDSLLLLRAREVPHGAKLADIGSGGGFPGVPVKIARGDISLTMIDSLNKRIKYLQALSERLGQANTCVHSRAEEAGRNPQFREQFDVVTARAVANLGVLAEYCLPLVKVGGVFLALKGPDCEAELAAAERALGKLGGKLDGTHRFTLPDGSGRTVVAIKKISHTSTSYPRPSAKIEKIPL